MVSGARSAGMAVPEVVAAQPLTARHSSAASAGRRKVTGKSNPITACCACGSRETCGIASASLHQGRGASGRKGDCDRTRGRGRRPRQRPHPVRHLQHRRTRDHQGRGRLRPVGRPSSSTRSATRPSTSSPGRPAGATCSPGSPGADPGRGALLMHGHLDVVPAEPADWSVHPFSGAVADGYVWGRGAIDMKDMVGMMIAVARHFKRAGHRAAARSGVRLRRRRGGRRQVRLRSGWSRTGPTCSTASPRRSARSAASR